ncbi:FAD-dependent oxidoreductase [Salipiger sp. 1_MG-2023]|uniref:FAD-dependent oxidoreductase n=1 Tax=Salipiger sp. 1_MG-2023 TaxID=3062665 RepID=UPI0034C64542
MISSDAALFPAVPGKLGRSLADKLRAMGVTLILGTRAETLASLTEPHAGSLTLGGVEHSFDLIFPAIGSRANSQLLESLPGVQKSTAQRIRTDPWMRPSSLPNVLAAGDVGDAGDAMTIVAASRQLPWLERTLKALVQGKALEQMKPYKPWGAKAPILVPLGPERGNSFLVAFTAGDWVTRKMKGEDLFLTKYGKLMGRKG